jgi:hypothetical protein
MCLTGALATPIQDEDALFRLWLSAFAEMQRGEAEAESNQWPRAIEKYRRSLSRFESLAADYPNYQTELVQYRIGNLAERIEGAQATLRAEFAEVAAEYDRAVSQIAQANGLDAASLFEAAYRNASRAIYRLRKLALNHPEFYADSLAENLAEAEGLTARLKSDFLATADGKALLSQIELDLSKELPDLDDSSLPTRPDILMSADLFPATIRSGDAANSG